MGSSLFVKDIPPIPIEHETHGPNSHQVPHDLPKQWFRHVGRESDIPEDHRPAPSNERKTSPKETAQSEVLDLELDDSRRVVHASVDQFGQVEKCHPSSPLENYL